MLPRSATTITALALGVVMAAAGSVGAADRDHPVVIELFQSQVWTPQVVVNGRIDTVGTRRGEIEQVIAKADRGLGEPQVRDPGAAGPRRRRHRGGAALGRGLVALAPAQQPVGDRGRDAGQEDRGDQPTHDGDGQGRIEAGALQRQGQ